MVTQLEKALTIRSRQLNFIPKQWDRDSEWMGGRHKVVVSEQVVTNKQVPGTRKCWYSYIVYIECPGYIPWRSSEFSRDGSQEIPFFPRSVIFTSIKMMFHLPHCCQLHASIRHTNTYKQIKMSFIPWGLSYVCFYFLGCHICDIFQDFLICYLQNHFYAENKNQNQVMFTQCYRNFEKSSNLSSLSI